MRTIVLAFSGRISSGKTTVSQGVAQALGWHRVGFGDYVRRVARERGVEPSRDNLHRIGAALVDAGVEEFCRAVLAQVEWHPGRPLVIDGVRHAAVLTTLRGIVLPDRLLLAHVVVDEDERLRRCLVAGSDDLEVLTRAEGHSTEVQVGSSLMSLADMIVDGNGPVESAVRDVLGFLE